MTNVKICGITNVDDATVAIKAGADLLGFIFYAKSPRYVSPGHAKEIIRAIRQLSPVIRCVGVFVDETLDNIRRVMELAQLDLVQLHGNESADMVRKLSPRGYKALRPRNANDARASVEQYRAVVNNNIPAFIVDAFDAKQYGGTGIRADWNIAANIAREFPILLAGGLNAENVADAIRVVKPWGVDVSSGVERAPGLKDHTRVREFIQKLKNDG
jgi:phosphoribosylanthranilate isomerase